MTKDMKCSKEIRTRIAVAKEAFTKKKKLLCGPLNKELRKRLAKCYIWSVALYGAETWTLRREDERRMEALEMWIWRKMEGIKWVDKVRNEEVLGRIGEERKILAMIKQRKKNWVGHCLRRENSIVRDCLEGMVSGRGSRGRRRRQLLDNVKVDNEYAATKRLAEDREIWRSSC